VVSGNSKSVKQTASAAAAALRAFADHLESKPAGLVGQTANMM